MNRPNQLCTIALCLCTVSAASARQANTLTSPKATDTRNSTSTVMAYTCIDTNTGISMAQTAVPSKIDYRARSLVKIPGISRLSKIPGARPEETVINSDVVDCGILANEFVVSWNAETPAETGIKVEARAVYPDRNSNFYTLGQWSATGISYPRRSVKNQGDADGDVLTDTLVLKQPTNRIKLRITLSGSRPSGANPTLKLLTICAADTMANVEPLPPDRRAWGKEIAVPTRTQLGWPGASGWCSPTSTDMVLAFWASVLKRPELDIPVPDAARATMDPEFNGTGNWPFNTAFAGSFSGIRAYVSRFSDVEELETWVLAGIPPVVSVSYDLLKGKTTNEDPGHLLVCVGFTDSGDIVLNDPAHSPDKGESGRRVFTRANFIRGWANSHNTVYLIYPESSKLPENRYGHW